MTSTLPKRKNLLSADTVKVRRFEPGATGVYFFEFLQSCGYDVHSANGHRYGIRRGKMGRFKSVSRAEIMEIVDAERKKRGLEPFKK